jgi:phage terminase large subunit-like protein
MEGETLTPSGKTLRSALLNLWGTPDFEDLLNTLGEDELDALLFGWEVWARSDQMPPEGDWTVWLILGGRGSGKTRSGAEWIRRRAFGDPFTGEAPVERMALVGETLSDVREVMIDGISGLMAIHPSDERPAFELSRRRLVWPNGAVAQIFSAEDPDSLRGPQFEAAWCDELAKWRYGQETWDMLQFGLRLGDNPRQVVTTTPRPTKLLKEIMDAERTVISRASTQANASNLSPAFLKSVVAKYQGTRLGRQELDGELIEEVEDALWSRAMIENLRVGKAPSMVRIAIGLDPPASSGKRSDACGLVAAGLGEDGHGYVLADASLKRAKPESWGRAAISLWHQWKADALVVEVNQGGEMAENVLQQIDDGVPITKVHASRGKFARAEPIATLYARGRIHHVGAFAELEDEMTTLTPKGLASGKSPDRLDALVWALSHLFLKGGKPGVRFL